MSRAERASRGAPRRHRHRAGDGRSWFQWVLVLFNVGLVAACVGYAGWLGYVYQRVQDFERPDLDRVLTGGRPEDEDEPREPGEPKNFLLVGSDSRQFVTETGEAGSFGSAEDFPDARADTILLVRVDPQAKRAQMLSFPRDLVVDVAGEGRGRINTAFEGGPEQLIATVSQTFDVPIHHYVQTDFAAFRELVDAVGGIELFLRFPIRDWGPAEPGQRSRNITGLAVNETGCQTLNGDQALAYVRSRHFEQLIDGEWEPDLSADLGRIRRQQDFVTRAVQKALREGLLDPRRLLRLLNAVDGNLTFDDNLGVNDVVELGRQFEDIAPDAIEQFTLPVEDIPTRGQFAGLRISDEAEADRILSVFRGEPPAGSTPVGTVLPADVTLQVLNGTGRGGEAASARTGLVAAGFTVLATGDRPPYDNATTTIEHPPGEEVAAATVASYLEGGAALVEDESVDTLVLVTGRDFTGVLATPRPASPTGPTSPTTSTSSTTSTTVSESEMLARFYAGIGTAECYAD